MTPLFVTPVEILVGVSFGLLFGAIVAALVGCASFATSYFTEASLPPIAGGAATAALAAGGFYAAGIVEPSTVHLGHGLGVGLGFVLGLYATSWGRRLAAAVPRFTTGAVERTQPLAADAIDAVDAVGQVTVRASGGVREFEGYPPLGPELRAALEDGAWRFPADLPLSALETRLEDRLRTSYDLEAVSVSVDGRGRATITAAPPANGVAKQVPEGWRAVSVRALVPTGLAPGDEVIAVTPSEAVSGTVLSTTVEAGADRGAVDSASTDATATDRSGAADSSVTAAASGGVGRVTVAVPTTDAEALLEAERVRVVVEPGETTHEFDAVSLLERDGAAIRKVTLTEPILEALDNDVVDLEVFAVRGDGADGAASEGEWLFEPDPGAVTVGREAFLLGSDGGNVDADPDASDRRPVEVTH